MNFVDLQTRFIGPQMCVNYIFKTFLDGRKEGKQTSRLGSARAEMFCQNIFWAGWSKYFQTSDFARNLKAEMGQKLVYVLLASKKTADALGGWPRAQK